MSNNVLRFDSVSEITIPEGNVSEIWIGNKLVWQKGEWITISGEDDLTLVNAVKSKIKSLIQYGKCEQSGTPTPASPKDIKCNNGTLNIISEGVPIEYIRVEYLQSSGTQYIDTGVAINYATQKIEQKATAQYTTSNTNRELMGSNGYGFWGKNASNKLESAAGNAVTVTESALNKNTVSLITDPTNNSVTFVVNSNRYESTASTLADNYYACYVFALGGRSGAAASFFCNAKVYEYTIILDNVVVSHLIPVKRRSDGVLGMYDTVTNSFKVNAGTGTFIAGGAVGSVGVIGTPEVLTIGGENLLDPTTVPKENRFISKGNGLESIPPAGSNYRHSDFIPVVGGQTYYIGTTPFTASNAGMAWYSEDSTSGYISGLSETQLKNADMKATAPDNATHIRFTWRIDEGYDTDWEHSVYFCRCINDEPVMTKWQPYVPIQTATVENLFAVGNVKDEQDLISGIVTKRVGVKILDGTETWTTDTYGGSRRFINYNFAKEELSVVSCTHYTSTIDSNTRTSLSNAYVASSGALVIYKAESQNIETVADWTSWLATQCAAGTPVIVVYPLEEETVEHVTPQPLNILSGMNLVSTESNISNVPLEVTYLKKN